MEERENKREETASDAELQRLVEDFITQKQVLLIQVKKGVLGKEEFLQEAGKHIDQYYHFPATKRKRLLKSFEQYIFGYSRLSPLMDDKSISDIRVVSHDCIRIKREGKRMDAGIAFASEKEYRQFIDYVATRNQVNISNLNAIQRFTDTESHPDFIFRFTLSMPIVNTYSEPYLCIRKVPKSFPMMTELVEKEMLDRNTAELLVQRFRQGSTLICGGNSSGKTTLLKIINELVPPDTGSIKLGSNVQIGYYDQEHHVLHMDKTLFEEISDDYPDLTNTQIRNTLAAFLFTGEDVFKKISSLSGGERGRVSLAKLMLSESNFLILDEPTNHLDITSKEILESALNAYEGTVLYVSHDRYFINKTASRILELTHREFINYIGNYDYYLEKKQTPMADESNSSVEESAPSAQKLDWKQQKEQQAAQRKKENDLKKCEDRIAQLEAKAQELDEEMSRPEIATNVARLQEIAREKNAIEEVLNPLYEKWEALSE